MSITDYQNIISNIGKIVLGINTVLFFVGFFRNGKAYKIFTAYLLSMSIIQLCTYYLWTQGTTNLHVAHYYLIVQFILLSIFFYFLFVDKSQKLLILTIFLLVIVGVFINSFIHPELLYKFSLIEILITSLPLVFFSIIHFYNSLSEKKKFTFVNSGIFIYILCSTLIFCSGNIVNEITTEFRTLLWFMNVVLYLVYQILITIEWFRNFRKKKSII